MRRRNLRGLARCVTVAVVTLALAACGSSGGSDGAEGGTAAGAQPTPGGDGGIGCPEAEGKVVGFSQPLPDPNFAAIEQVLNEALATHGAELRSVTANLDPGKQISDLQTLLQQQVAVLIANPVDPNATKPIFDQFRARDIPIVALDTEIGGPFLTEVKEDMRFAAAEGAKLLKETVGDGQVGAIYGPPFAEILNWEKDAFDAAAKEVGLNVVATGVNQEISPQGAKRITDAWKQKYGADLKGIWTFSDTTAIGAASSLGGDFTPAIVSINGQPDVVPLVQAGKVTATFQVPYEKTGQALAYAALQAICGRDVPPEIVVPVSKLDQSNIGSYRPVQERAKDPFEVELEEREGTTFIKVDAAG